jgi:hypothetical protein
MFDYLFHPYLRWLRSKSQDDGLGFDVDRDGLPHKPCYRTQASFPRQNPKRCLRRFRRPALLASWLNSRMRFRAFA